MATKICCDVCGKEAKHSEAIKRYYYFGDEFVDTEYNARQARLTITLNFGPQGNSDLCDECRRSIVKYFIDNMQKTVLF
jgi:hypothetical protein